MIAIIGAMQEETEILTARIEAAQLSQSGGFNFVSGRLAGKEVVLLQCGIGKVNAAVGAALLLERFPIRALINTGSAGGLLAEQKVGDLVVSSAALQHDVDICAFGYEKGQLPGLPAVFPADLDLAERAETVVAVLKARSALDAGINCTRGIIGSGDVFMHEAQRLLALRQDFPGLCAVEMEGAAIAQVCFLFKTPFVILRALSDIAGQDSPIRFDDFLPVAARNSSILVEELVKGI